MFGNGVGIGTTKISINKKKETIQKGQKWEKEELSEEVLGIVNQATLDQQTEFLQFHLKHMNFMVLE